MSAPEWTHTYDEERNRTTVLDEEGEPVFWLPGIVEVPVIQRVVQVHERAYHLGVESGRAALAADLRRLLGVS